MHCTSVRPSVRPSVCLSVCFSVSLRLLLSACCISIIRMTGVPSIMQPPAPPALSHQIHANYAIRHHHHPFGDAPRIQPEIVGLFGCTNIIVCGLNWPSVSSLCDFVWSAAKRFLQIDKPAKASTTIKPTLMISALSSEQRFVITCFRRRL